MEGLGREEQIAPSTELAVAHPELEDSLLPSLPKPIMELIDRMLDGTEPYGRPLKEWDVLKFNPRHINMCVLRASGFKVKEVAELMGYERQGVYQTMTHPYAKKLISALTAQTSAQVLDIRGRIEDYASDLLDETFKLAMEESDLDKLSKVTFGLLDRAGHGVKEAASGAKAPGSGEIQAEASVLNRLSKALEGSKMVDREVMPTWIPRRPPEENFEDGQAGSASVGAEGEGGPSHGASDSSTQSSSQPSRRSA